MDENALSQRLLCPATTGRNGSGDVPFLVAFLPTLNKPVNESAAPRKACCRSFSAAATSSEGSSSPSRFSDSISLKLWREVTQKRNRKFDQVSIFLSLSLAYPRTVRNVCRRQLQQHQCRNKQK